MKRVWQSLCLLWIPAAWSPVRQAGLTAARVSHSAASCNFSEALKMVIFLVLQQGRTKCWLISFIFFHHNWSFLFCHSVKAYFFFFCLWQALFFPLQCCLEVRGSLCLAINCQNLPVNIVNLHTPWWALPWTRWVATRSPSCCVTCLGSSCSVPSLAAVISLQEIQNLFHVLQWTFSCLEGLCSWIVPLPFLFLTSHIRQNYSSKKKSSAVAMCPVLSVCLSVRVNVLWVLNLCVRHGWLLQGEHLHRLYWLLLTVFACVIENVVSERRPQATLPEIC